MRLGVCTLFVGLGTVMQFLTPYYCLVFLGNLHLAHLIADANKSDVYLNTPQLIEKYGYPAETHNVTTADGYVLTLHRIPYSPKSPAAPNKPAVFVQHGLLGSSADWIILGPNKSLGYLLADAGYDVWMGNVRGNTYSKKHSTLSTDSYKYWDFSWHEMGTYDLPAMTDYVLNRTGQEGLYYVGFSMGATIFFVFTSTKPEYNEKIRLMIALAPSAFMANSTTPINKSNLFTKSMLQILSSMKIKEFLARSTLVNFLTNKLCSHKQARKVCSHILFLLCGYDAKQLNESLLPVIFSHLPAGTSWKSFLHYFQEMIAAPGKFRQYDYGDLNMAKYNQRTPPEYNLKAVTTPVSIFYGKNDPFSDPTDVLKLNRTLRNAVDLYRVQWDAFNHIDFLWANDVRPLINDRVISLLKKFEVLT